jgi:archaellum component FlaF (FlaF/FlaG flagellin family)
MPLNVDQISASSVLVDGVEIKNKPKDSRDYILSKEDFETVIYSLDRGEFILNNDYFTFPEDELYVLAGVETYLKFQEAQTIIEPSVLQNKKINVTSSIETYLKFLEAVAVNYNYNSKTGFQQQLLELINDTTYFDEEVLETKTNFTDRLLDKGIVEFGQIGGGSKLVYSEILKKTIASVQLVIGAMQNGNLENYDLLKNLFDSIIDKGIVVRTYKNNLIISSVEKYLQFLEAENAGGAVPV